VTAHRRRHASPQTNQTKPPRKRRSDEGGTHEQPESKLQVACVAWAETEDLVVDGSPGGAAFKKGAHKARGCTPGRADLLILEPGGDGSHGLAVELKIGRNGLQDSQREWLARVERKGWRTGVARSLAEFQALVRAHRLPGGAGSASDPFIM